jgi:hypothetical protein
MPRQARIVRSDVKVRTEAAAGQKNGERQHGEQSVHCSVPYYLRPQVMVYYLGKCFIIERQQVRQEKLI